MSRILLIITGVVLGSLLLVACDRKEEAPMRGALSESPSVDEGGQALQQSQTAAIDEVMRAQQALKEHGHDPGAMDGVMTPRTEQELIEFQKAQGLAATGRLDDRTKEALGLEQR